MEDPTTYISRADILDHKNQHLLDDPAGYPDEYGDDNGDHNGRHNGYHNGGQNGRHSGLGDQSGATQYLNGFHGAGPDPGLNGRTSTNGHHNGRVNGGPNGNLNGTVNGSNGAGANGRLNGLANGAPNGTANGSARTSYIAGSQPTSYVDPANYQPAGYEPTTYLDPAGSQPTSYVEPPYRQDYDPRYDDGDYDDYRPDDYRADDYRADEQQADYREDRRAGDYRDDGYRANGYRADYADDYRDDYRDDYADDDYADDYEDEPLEEDEEDSRDRRTRKGAAQPPVRSGRGGRTAGGGSGKAVRTSGELLLTFGMVVLLFVIYQLWITNIFSAQKQNSATNALEQQWADGNTRTDHYNLTDGSGIAELYIPAFGTDYHFTVIEGTTLDDLAIGPGHYKGTALPGQPGNFSVAGHRVGQGDPFNDIGLLQSCDSIVIETNANWYVYRVLPFTNEVSTWSTSRGSQALCQGPNGDAKVPTMTGVYSQTVGQEIVLPSEGDEVAPVPHHPGITLPAGQQQLSLITLTTCNPQFSDAQRLIVHGILVKKYAKNPSNPNAMPPEMREQS